LIIEKYLYTTYEFNLGPNPFIPEESIHAGVRVKKSIPREVAYQQERKRILDARLIKFIGKEEIVGIPKEKIIEAFGEPEEIIQITDTKETWKYRPWENKNDWVLPVYIENELLTQIGD
jgi:hypothetical protein